MLDEVPVQIPQRHIEGWLFIGLFLLIPLIILQRFIGFEILRWIIAISFTFLFFYTLKRINDMRIRAGPARGWFRRGMIKAWVSLDGEDLVVRSIWKGQEAYRPSRVDWTMPQAFMVREGETSFELVFQSSDDAAKFVARMKANIPGILESAPP